MGVVVEHGSAEWGGSNATSDPPIPPIRVLCRVGRFARNDADNRRDNLIEFFWLQATGSANDDRCVRYEQPIWTDVALMR